MSLHPASSNEGCHLTMPPRPNSIQLVVLKASPHLNRQNSAARNLGEVAVGGHKAARLVELASGIMRDVGLPAAVKVDERPRNHLPANEQQQAQIVAGEADAAARLGADEARAGGEGGEDAEHQRAVDEPEAAKYTHQESTTTSGRTGAHVAR